MTSPDCPFVRNQWTMYPSCLEIAVLLPCHPLSLFLKIQMMLVQRLLALVLLDLLSSLLLTTKMILTGRDHLQKVQQKLTIAARLLDWHRFLHGMSPTSLLQILPELASTPSTSMTAASMSP